MKQLMEMIVNQQLLLNFDSGSAPAKDSCERNLINYPAITNETPIGIVPVKESHKKISNEIRLLSLPGE